MANRGKQRPYEQMQFEERRGKKFKPKKSSANLIAGIVTRARGHHFDVQTDPSSDNRVRVCEVRGRLRIEKQVDTLVAVGDHVWVLPNGADRGLIEQVEERQTVLSRQRPGANMLAEDVILANPDQVLIVFAAAEPEPHLRLLDRFLVVAEFNELPAVICVNKIDLAGIDHARALFGPYAEIGYPVIYASTVLGEGIEAMHALLQDKITVVSGPSGVGKSSLINAIHPTLNLQVGDLREFLNKGKHTTRAAQLFRLPVGDNTYIADTPGIRELGLYDIDPADLSFYFIEMQEYLHDCHFPGCTHDHEPACAVRDAVQAGKIAQARYDSYLRLLHGEE
ncbi:MAG: ribosome small subunit-dependent GTPase A [Caldilineaceae bacterium]